jgi:hypothetical protein
MDILNFRINFFYNLSYFEYEGIRVSYLLGQFYELIFMTLHKNLIKKEHRGPQ